MSFVEALINYVEAIPRFEKANNERKFVLAIHLLTFSHIFNLTFYFIVIPSHLFYLAQVLTSSL